MVKGAPQTLAKLIEKQGGQVNAGVMAEQMSQLTRQGKRVVALGYQIISQEITEIDPNMIGKGLNLVGLVGIIDPPVQKLLML